MTGVDQSAVEKVIVYTPAVVPNAAVTTWNRGSVLDSETRASFAAVIVTVTGALGWAASTRAYPEIA
jgi:hypothetical protein